tara:strand:- start:736 stop:1908 length:1173 start_codon:yes stop_codon:yes gene_type:complete
MSSKGQITTKQYPIEQLIFAEYNPRQLTKDQYQGLKDSITRFGLVDPVIVNKHKDRKNIIVGGHQRVKVAKDLGFKDVPCVEVSLTLDKERELNIRLNRNTGEWDWDSLANYFDVSDLLEWGFTDDDLQFKEPELVEGKIEDDEIPEVEEAITKPGDMWILGEHRVLCGDSTNINDGKHLMNGKKADMVFTDPPYGVNVTGAGGNALHGDLTFTLIPFSFDLIDAHLSNGGAIYFCGGSSNVPLYFKLFEKYCRMMPHLIIWVKDSFVLRRHHYHSRYEIVFFGWKKGKKSRWYSDRKQDDVWEISREKHFEHPTIKPVELIIKALDNSCGKGEICLDPFLGSGSTLIACEKTNRKCYGMEIDPHYCDVIVKRWEEYTGNKAERIEAASA